MNPERWQQVKQVFQDALDLPSLERAAFVREACAADPELLAEVESLLKSQEDSATFLSDAAVAYVPSALDDVEPPDVNLGRRIGPYQVLREIGSGGMGSVYLAERVDEFRQKVALKLMKAGLDSRMVVSRFRHERQILAGLDHPNIARLLDGGATDSNQPYFVMEFVEGTPIDSYADSHNLSIKERLQLFRQVCSAVQYAHQNLIVHRDLKPGNILVTQDGTPKLLDFGIAKLLREEPMETAVTQVGMRLMTPEYASPEQARGLPIATASDVYSLGVVFYQLLTGKMPYEFPARSSTEVERVICETEASIPSARVSGAASKQLAGDLDNIALKALEKDPLRRYSSVEQFSADIQRHLEGLPIQARPQTLVYRAGRFVRRNRLSVGAAALVVLSLTGGLIATAWQAHVARQQRARAERRFNEVRQIAESFLFEFDGQIKNLAGSTPARKLLVQKALGYLRSLSEEAAGDLALDRDLAKAYIEVGNVQGNPYEKNLGDTTGALDSYQKALAIAQDITRRDPRDVEGQRYLAKAHSAIGDVTPLLGNPHDAVPHYQAAIATLEAVKPGDPNVRLDLAEDQEALGDLLGRAGLPNLGDPNGAREQYQKALATTQSLEPDPGSNARPRRGIGVLLMKLGDLDLEAGRVDPALDQYQKAAAILEQLSAADPSDARALSAMIMINEKIAGAWEEKGQVKAALDQYQKMSEIKRRLMDADPANAKAKMDYAASLKTRADLLAKSGNSKGALTVYRDVLAYAQKASAAQPDNLLWRGRYAEMLNYVGFFMADSGDRNEALRLYRQSLSIAKEMADRPGATPDDVSQYASFLLDSPFDELRNPNQALSYARRAVDLANQPSADLKKILDRAIQAAKPSR